MAVGDAGGEQGAVGVARRLLLLGRDRELAQVDGLILGVLEGGGALVVRGEPGIGKSALLIYAARQASDRGMGVVTTGGAQSELNLTFAGLHRLLLPFLGGVSDLPPLQRSALDAAFGRAGAEAPDIFLVGVASLGLIADAAADAPVLLVVDDAQWLDGPSAQVLAFVARRVGLEQVVVLFGVRDEVSGGAEMAGLPEVRLDPLDDDTARSLLRESAGDLPDALSDRIVRDAAGNPLALIELPRAVARAGDMSLIQPLPLTERLEQVFAARLGDLSLDARCYYSRLSTPAPDTSIARLRKCFWPGRSRPAVGMRSLLRGWGRLPESISSFGTRSWFPLSIKRRARTSGDKHITSLHVCSKATPTGASGTRQQRRRHQTNASPPSSKRWRSVRRSAALARWQSSRCSERRS
jgi:AAA ATPase domain